MVETQPRRAGRPKHRRRRGLIVLLSLILVLAGAAAAVGSYYAWAIGASGPKKPFVLTIPAGATGTEVADLLEDKGVIRSTLGFRVLSRFRGFSAGFEAGRYHVTTNMTVEAILDVLKAGPFVETVSATFPEGYTVRQMARRAADELGVSESQFRKLAESGDYSIPPYLPEGTDTVEGFLFPSTYQFEKDLSAKDVIQRMLDQFEREAAKLPWDNAEELGVTPYEVVVIASMIEREARVDKDRPLVSAVIYNRIEKGMRLEIDATVRYALNKPSGPLTQSDLDVDSPYNTRKFPGIPPTPIASPGFASLRAALEPADVNYLYFLVVDPSSGEHAFTASYDEFLRLKAQANG